MKAVTVTAIVALVLSIPFLIRRGFFQAVPLRLRKPTDQDKRYDNEDFLT